MPTRQPSHTIRWGCPLAVAVAAVAAPALAQPTSPRADEPLQPLRLSDPSYSLRALPQPAPEPVELEDEPVDFREAPERHAFGDAGSHWLIVGGAAASSFDDAYDLNLHVGYGYFLSRNVEVVGELATWYFGQEEGDAVGLNPTIAFRWHVVNEEKWSLFAEAGIGLLFASDDVPSRGTSFNFTPRAGVGFTRRITDGGVRLEAGLRWHHISNARIIGETDNPGRDAPLVFASLIFPI